MNVTLKSFLEGYELKNVSELEDVNMRFIRIRKNNTDFLVKLTRVDHSIREKYLQNFEKLKGLSHRNLLYHKDIASLDPSHFEFNVAEIVEYLNFGTLIEYLKSNISFSRVIDVFKQSFIGLNFLHERGILHRDIKLTNFFVHLVEDEPIVKVGDIEFWEGADTLSSRTTPEYMAPEVVLYSDYTVKSEIWAIGVMFYELFLGKYPFGSRLEGVEIECILENAREKAIDDIEKIPPPFNDIVELCLQKDVEKRPGSLLELIGILDSVKFRLN
ncbi:hypothetical protein GCM10011506_37920 [Marivirga lumbricoides]|uniref:Protein kinase domain-containing protein n=1 Tax=Marivirga lumbricoides TaxID=1046115 RepID=A0ABQ1MY18_9BACT|nr:hypothetical protein GCM10011506_37920 [Marivirga lumbricoides]